MDIACVYDDCVYSLGLRRFVNSLFFNSKQHCFSFDLNLVTKKQKINFESSMFRECLNLWLVL